jgi:hypothetical protein
MSFQAYHSPLRGPDGDLWLRAAARQYWETYGKPILITLEEMQRLADQHASTSVAQNVTGLLNYLVRHSPRPGTDVPINVDNDYTVVDARDRTELVFYLDHLCKVGLITLTGRGATLHDQTYQLTYGGWDHVLGTSAGFAEYGRVFVAMSFDESMDLAYRDGIEPALSGAGYVPVCMKSVLHNDDINFTILAEIRRAQFVVADITGARGGVYFEAGFARALGRDVFFTCREDRFKEDRHFDTEHFQHTMWTTPTDLQSKLREKVLAPKGPGPNGVRA